MKETSISRRAFLGGLTAAMVVAGTGACGSRGESGGAGPIRWLNDEGDPGTLKVLRAINEEYADKKGKSVTISGVPADTDLYTKVLTSIKAGRPYDLTSAVPGRVAGWAAEDYLRPLDNLIQSLGGEDAFLPNTLIKSNGSYVFMPVNVTAYMLNYRADWLEEIGEDVPRTWDQLKTVSKKLTGGDRYGIALPMSTGQGETTVVLNMNLLWSNNVEFFDEDGNVILDQGEMKERCVQCLEFLKELQPYMAEGMTSAGFDDIINAFLNGIVGIAPYAGRLLSNVIASAPEMADDVIMEGFPTPDGEKLAITPVAEGLAVLEPGSNAAAAEEYLGWFMQNGVVDFLHTVPLHLLPARESTYNTEEWRSNPALKKYADSLQKMRTALTSEDYIRNSLDIMTPGVTTFKAKISASDVIPEMYQKVLIGDTTPTKAVEEAAARMRELIGG